MLKVEGKKRYEDLVYVSSGSYLDLRSFIYKCLQVVYIVSGKSKGIMMPAIERFPNFE